MASTKRQTAKAATRAKVLEAAKTCFGTLGYERATIRDIANTAGMSTGAIFASFTGKAELYREVFGHDPISPEVGRELLERLQAIIDWADLALSNPAEFDSHGVRNLDGPVFDEARAAVARATSTPSETRQDKAA